MTDTAPACPPPDDARLAEIRGRHSAGGTDGWPISKALSDAAYLLHLFAARDRRIAELERWVRQLIDVSDPFLSVSPDEIDRVRERARAALPK